jgi:hypothetical protein
MHKDREEDVNGKRKEEFKERGGNESGTIG